MQRKPKEPKDQQDNCDRPKHSSIRSHVKGFLDLTERQNKGFSGRNSKMAATGERQILLEFRHLQFRYASTWVRSIATSWHLEFGHSRKRNMLQLCSSCRWELCPHQPPSGASRWPCATRQGLITHRSKRRWRVSSPHGIGNVVITCPAKKLNAVLPLMKSSVFLRATSSLNCQGGVFIK
jgi:hypothetical protein